MVPSTHLVRDEKSTPQQTLIVEKVWKAASKNTELMGVLITNPARFFASAGYPLQSQDYQGFNDFHRKEFRSILEHLNRGEKLEEVINFKCTACKVGCYAIASAIAAIGTAGLAYLTVTTPAVIALASFTGLAEETVLTFIQGLGSTIAEGVSAVAEKICTWVGVCSS